MIQKPISLTRATKRDIEIERTMRSGWVVRWDGQHIEHCDPTPLPQIRR